MNRHLLLIAACLLAVTRPLTAQTIAQDSVLKGLTKVDAQLFITWGLTSQVSTTEEGSKAAVLARFTLELRKLGLVVASDAPNVLWCDLNIQPVSGSMALVAYTMQINFREPVTLPRLGRSTWATTWNTGALGSLGTDHFAEMLDNEGRACAERFGNAWLAANPKRP